ncbi:gastrula zinc finger protein XlCGF57.1-like isoform X10 [Tribolium madens]|uniref:gastrula zinc finger protein XlCGF57.1-like isoform X10 n=1 Tax=Tribolium madens TaxID=41895 RepID=UPI001CF73A8A|nr:gastrula zinc finger protein XlCGF57.1-like isoform X10 [Tribolium madens]
MGSIENISELCRLCLVKDQVNVPIFEENASKEQTFVKINSCLPVKVSRDDSLPKKICDGCSCKLDMLYNFRNTSVDSEKQLLKWLNQADLSCSQSAAKDPLASTKPEIMIKQETFEPTDSRGDDNSDMGMDTHSYLMQQQKLPYPQEFEFGGPSESNVGLMTDEPAPKRAKRAAALNKAPIETDDDDLDAAMQITKAEEEDSEEIDQPDYVEAPSTSADDQPGPSGVGKASVEAPFKSPSNTAKESYECQVCLKVFSSSEQLSDHKSSHREGNQKCPLCDKTFLLLSAVRRHILRYHKKNIKFYCKNCDYKTNNKSRLQLHLISRHTKAFPLKCEVCNKGFLSKTALATHKEVAHDGKRFVCELCSKMFMSYDCFKRHVKQHDPNYVERKFSCSHCSRLFNYKGHLKRHIETIHSDEGGRYVCNVCGKRLTSNTSLNNHTRIHAGEKNFVCDVCGKAFVLKNTLDVHTRVHTKERPFKCTECDMAFSQSSTLENHRKIHAGEKNFVCEVCGKAFVARNTLKVHTRVHTKEKPFNCSKCDKAFPQKCYLNIHMRYHTGERPYKCDVCHKQFITKGVLKHHKCKSLE